MSDTGKIDKLIEQKVNEKIRLFTQSYIILIINYLQIIASTVNHQSLTVNRISCLISTSYNPPQSHQNLLLSCESIKFSHRLRWYIVPTKLYKPSCRPIH